MTLHSGSGHTFYPAIPGSGLQTDGDNWHQIILWFQAVLKLLLRQNTQKTHLKNIFNCSKINYLKWNASDVANAGVSPYHCEAVGYVNATTRVMLTPQQVIFY